jgi:hypothetical protein
VTVQSVGTWRYLKMKKGLNRTLSVISKIAEIAAWIGVVAGLIAFAGSFNKDVAQEIVAGKSEMLQSVGFELGVITSTGVINYFALSMYYLGTVIAFVLIALIFRNLDIILHTISGRYEKAESTSPFQKDVVKRVKNNITPQFKQLYNEKIFDANEDVFNNSYVRLCISASNINKAKYIDQIKYLKSTYLDANIRINIIDEFDNGEMLSVDGFNTNIQTYIEDNIPEHLNNKYEYIKEKMIENK